ncbi:HAD hydrolase [Fomitiporia mediterranea MF3/22]|uniref:HAD hydrolase n=1 Tax=Fomitiporia mediterranea (strain MF3/22) TaxID=694068 RepID=UPI00044093E5|nr:HAD hydrolase [Fomitiporia mediterranea MF3/22]EJD03270.1 HAD hydrolase [Fomitiporia mediterranea MF3/22]
MFFSLSQATSCRLPRQLVQCQRRWNSLASSSTRAQRQSRPPLAFAFDIDGVLLRGNEVIPQARRALRMLDGENELGIKIPYIFITNGGGVSETTQCQRLSKSLGVEVSLSQFMQAHTVLKTVVEQYADKPVLVLGGRPGAIPQVAKEYGFRKVYTTLDILSWNPNVWPFHDLTSEERAFIDSRPKFDPTTCFAGVFVFHDPRNWALDAQITCDIICNNGYVLPAPKRPTTEALAPQEQEPVSLVFCNPDLLWGNEYPTPRIGQGGFRVAFQAVYQALNGKPYPCMQFGKPTKATYAFAEQLLRGRLKELLYHQPQDSMKIAKEVNDYTPNVYMVGDNPESDIAGANAVGWSSVLVKTGVYDPAGGPPTHKPSHITGDVEQAVHWAINQELSRI